MTDSSSGLDSLQRTSIPDAPSSASRWKHAILAGVLSLFFPGVGQLYNRQPRRALAIGIVSYLSGVLVAHTRLLLSFRTMVAAVAVGIVWKLVVVIDAVRSAGRSERAESRVPAPWFVYSVLAVILFISAITPSANAFIEEAGFRAFKIPSVSMCPTICLGDRIVVDMNAYRKQKPQRGDLIVMKHASSDALFVKRVIGLPGDVVSPGPDGSVLVNGQPFHAPTPCAMPTWDKSVTAAYIEFHETNVPDENYFVVGDNLRSSYDSRFGEFGAVTADMIRGRPLYFYWSPTRARIGCAIR